MYLPAQVTRPSKASGMPDRIRSNDYATDRSSSNVENGLRTSIKSNFIREFFCSIQTLSLGPKASSSLEVYYLPFDMHIRYCAIILSNKEIGDLIYIIEGKGLIPLPSNFLPMKPPSPIDYSISLEENHSQVLLTAHSRALPTALHPWNVFQGCSLWARGVPASAARGSLWTTEAAAQSGITIHSPITDQYQDTYIHRAVPHSHIQDSH
ncbi:cilia- and flagella-associated protein 47-like [Rattus rattus]|uniref:cilia- and flagella-associated protein 47-like n=1 Tax=Rattus rattus TaxID=10117 RepID=UPI0013F30EE5|nr:cilia- and flagella-associated protein 47-like [Rattus rattus]